MVAALSGTWLAVESLAFGVYMATHRPVRPMPNTPIRVLRLRVYGGMPQVAIVTGNAATEQVVFNAITGRRASQTEPGYPEVGFPFGWQAHQTAKKIHRGDYIGLSGRWMDLFAGLSMVFLSVSATVMYFNMWSKRRQTGGSGLMWM